MLGGSSTSKTTNNNQKLDWIYIWSNFYTPLNEDGTIVMDSISPAWDFTGEHQGRFLDSFTRGLIFLHAI